MRNPLKWLFNEWGSKESITDIDKKEHTVLNNIMKLQSQMLKEQSSWGDVVILRGKSASIYNSFKEKEEQDLLNSRSYFYKWLDIPPKRKYLTPVISIPSAVTGYDIEVIKFGTNFKRQEENTDGEMPEITIRVMEFVQPDINLRTKIEWPTEQIQHNQ